MTRSGFLTSRLSACLGVVLIAATAQAAFVTFESGHVRPLALSPDGTRLYAVNTPDDRLEIFDVGASGLTHAGSVPVGLEPVAVAARTNGEVWVVNHLSDSISIVDVAISPARVTRTLLVGDEPRDIVFAGPGGNRAFITSAHRGQNIGFDPQLTTPGVGRADVWVFDALDLGTSLGGTPLTVVTLFGDTPRALATSPSGNTVYAAVFHSGNQTTPILEQAVCNGGSSAPPCDFAGFTMPGGLPAPNRNVQNVLGPETGLIVRLNPANSRWEDRLGRDWTPAVRFDLPDRDVFALDANGNPPAQTGFFATVGTVIFNMVANPVSGKVYVTNTEARNEVRFEGPGGGGSTVRGHLHEARITVLDGASVNPRHLNKHIDYAVVPSPVTVKNASLATPVGMAITSDGATLYVAAFGSGKVGVFDTAQLETDTFTPGAASHIGVSGGGPSGLVLDEARDRLYVFTRFDNAISVIDTVARSEIAHLPVFNPEPASVRNGRPFLYDAVNTSSNGEAACAACHIFGDFDSLAWDLGNPDDVILNNPNPFRLGPAGDPDFHPMKGPMATQTLRGMANNGPMHWRGDRTGGNDPGGSALDEHAGFVKFNVAFDGLLGRGSQLTTAEMNAFTDFILQVTLPPNPVRALDNSLDPTTQQPGRDLFFGRITDGFSNCNGCHVLDAGDGFFGTDGQSTFEGETQHFKVPHLRNVYQKVGMFGITGGPHTGNQVRGLGFLHDGTVDTLFTFHGAAVFNLTPAETVTMVNFMLAFDSDLAPIVGQQVTLTSSNAGVAGPRISLLLARAAALECDVVVKGLLGGVPRGWMRTSAGRFQSDRAGDATLTDAALRAQVGTAGQERTYTAVPVGSGTRIGVDRDEDGFFDQDEVDAGSDPADPSSTPGGSTTSTTTTTLPQPSVIQRIPTSTMSLKDDSVAPANPAARKLTFRSKTKRQPPGQHIVPPIAGDLSADPRTTGAVLFVYNSAGLTTDSVSVFLPASKWTASGVQSYRFSDPSGPVSKITLRMDTLLVKAGKASWSYTLNEPQQGRIALKLAMGQYAFCSDAPARSSGNPSSTLPSDHVDRFVAAPDFPAPLACVPVP
jgi:YVTN family beta-propeller protein